ncbi:hypothetical protein ACRAWD_15480 [Caulobacter segnis]
MTSLRFRARIDINGVNPFVPVEPEQAARLREGAGASRCRSWSGSTARPPNRGGST